MVCIKPHHLILHLISISLSWYLLFQLLKDLFFISRFLQLMPVSGNLTEAPSDQLYDWLTCWDQPPLSPCGGQQRGQRLTVVALPIHSTLESLYYQLSCQGVRCISLAHLYHWSCQGEREAPWNSPPLSVIVFLGLNLLGCNNWFLYVSPISHFPFIPQLSTVINIARVINTHSISLIRQKDEEKGRLIKLVFILELFCSVSEVTKEKHYNIQNILFTVLLNTIHNDK